MSAAPRRAAAGERASSAHTRRDSVAAIYYEDTRLVLEIPYAELRDNCRKYRKNKLRFVALRKTVEDAVPGRAGGLVQVSSHEFLKFTSFCEIFRLKADRQLPEVDDEKDELFAEPTGESKEIELKACRARPCAARPLIPLTPSCLRRRKGRSSHWCGAALLAPPARRRAAKLTSAWRIEKQRDQELPARQRGAVLLHLVRACPLQRGSAR